MSPHPGGPLNMSDHTVADDGAYYYHHYHNRHHEDASVAVAARGALANHEMSADNGYTEAHFFCGTFATGDYCA
jgi:hypothetical protein